MAIDPSTSALLKSLHRAGFRGDSLKKAYAIAMRESGGRPTAFNPDVSTGDQSYGLFQINMLGNLGPARRKQFGLTSNEELLNPEKNAQVAFRMSKGGTDWGAWGIGPNAYRRDPGLVSSFQKYYQQFPEAAYKSMLATGKLLSDSAQSVDPKEVANFTTRTGVLTAQQDEDAKARQSEYEGRLRLNRLLEFSNPTQASVSILQRLGGTSASFASRFVNTPTPLSEPTPPPQPPSMPITKPLPTTQPDTVVTQETGEVTLAAGGGWGGSYNIAKTLADVGVANGLKVWSEKRDRKNTASGGVSDHWTGSKTSYAYDLSNGDRPTKEMDQTAKALLAQFGQSWDGKSPIVFNTTTDDGYRVQILYRTNVGGNHYNHVHIGVRKV